MTDSDLTSSPAGVNKAEKPAVEKPKAAKNAPKAEKPAETNGQLPHDDPVVEEAEGSEAEGSGGGADEEVDPRKVDPEDFNPDMRARIQHKIKKRKGCTIEALG